VRLEDALRQELARIAEARRVTLGMLVEEINQHERGGNLSSALRVFVLTYVGARSTCSNEKVGAAEGDAPSL
jgi:predicted DNA-binding ribbon-helix-helix protein